MARLVYSVIVGLVGALIVHIIVLFLVPSYSERDAWTRLNAVTTPFRIHEVGQQGDLSGIPRTDPLLREAVCLFDLAGGPVRLSDRQSVPFWSVSVFDSSGTGIYSYSDRTSIENALDLVVGSPEQLLDLGNALPDELGRSILIESRDSAGIIVVRAFQPDESYRPLLDRFVAGLACGPVADGATAGPASQP